MTQLDLAVNTFIWGAGGIDFIATIFSIPIIFVIIASIIRPLNV